MKVAYNYKITMNKKRQFVPEFKTPFVPIKQQKIEPSIQTSLTASHGVTVTRQKNLVP